MNVGGSGGGIVSDEKRPAEAERTRSKDDSAWPADIDPESGFRLPAPRREELDDDGKRRYDSITGGRYIAGLQGPAVLSLFSPKTADPRSEISRYLREEASLSPRVKEIAFLITSRAMDGQFQWTTHEPEAIKAGVPATVVDVIKFRKSVDGLDPIDSAVIELGRAIWEKHKVSAELFRSANAAFGPQNLVDLVLLMGTHATSSGLLAAFGMQLRKGSQPLLPIP